MQPGTRLGPYEIIARIGAGGMGEVYRARDARLGRDVAIKVLPAGFAADSDRLRRFEQEARATAALNHPNILSIFDIGSHEGSPYLVEELLEGESLRQLLTTGPLPYRKAVEIAAQIARGLSATHGKGILHRDLKPENVFITGDGVVKILDFGLAKLVSDEDGVDLTAQPTATAPQVVVGTAAYMSPEQARGQEVDHRSDIFALGVILYEMLSGRSPFRRTTLAGTASAILHEEPPALTASVESCPPPLDTVVRRCLEKRPPDRFSSAHDLAFALEAVSWPQAAAVDRAPTEAGPRRRRRLLQLAAAAAVIVVGGALTVWMVARRGGETVTRVAAPQEKLMLAVLPMENLSRDPEQEYFSDGMTEELIAQLGRLEPGRLGVIARTSAMHYKHTAKSIAEIGRELGVEYLLEGSVRREGQRVRITAQLIQVGDQTHLWADSFERDASAVFAVQEEVAKRVAHSLAIELLPGRAAALSRKATSNPAAHEAYLRALYLWNKRGKGELEQAARLFQHAVDLDPSFAAAYAGLAHAFLALYSNGSAPAATTMPPAEAAVAKALELDPDLAAAFTARGGINEGFQWKWSAAAQDYRRALELEPGAAAAHYLYGRLLFFTGTPDQGLAEFRTAVRLDPASLRMNFALGLGLTAARRYDEARVQFEKTIQLFPEAGAPHIGLANVYELQGRRAEAAAEWGKTAELYRERGYGMLYRAQSLALVGQAREARRLLEAVQRQSAEYISPIEAAQVSLTLGDEDGALALLEHGVEAHDGEVAILSWQPLFDPLRSSPRFQALMRRMNLPVQ